MGEKEKPKEVEIVKCQTCGIKIRNDWDGTCQVCGTTCQKIIK